MQAGEALKVLLGLGATMSHHLLVYEALDCTFTRVRRGVDPGCPLCGPEPTVTELVEHDYSCARPRAATEVTTCPPTNT